VTLDKTPLDEARVAALLRVRVAEAFRGGPRVTSAEARLYYAGRPARAPFAVFAGLERAGLIAWETGAGWTVTAAGRAELDRLVVAAPEVPS